jgi:hypothetical protein
MGAYSHICTTEDMHGDTDELNIWSAVVVVVGAGALLRTLSLQTAGL